MTAAVIRLLSVYGALVGLSATLVVFANFLRGIALAQRRAMWRKFAIYLAVTGSVFATAWIHPLVYGSLVLLIALLTLDELSQALGARRSLALSVGGLLLIGLMFGQIMAPMWIAFSLMLIPLLGTPERSELNHLKTMVLALCYVIAFSAGHLLLVSGWRQNLLLPGVFFGLVSFCYLLIVVNEAMGQLWGRFVGRHKLCVQLSPAKTVEGLFCGTGSTLLVSLLLQPLVPQWATWQILLAAGLLSLASTVGDLVASAFKRAVSIKDFSQRLGPHGGVLDRFDGFLFASPLIYFFGTTWSGLT